MMAATVIERLHGPETALKWVYHSPVFMALWAVAAVCGLIWLVSRGTPKRFFIFLLHVSFVVILVGALVTHLAGKSGEIHLRTGEPSSVFVKDDGTGSDLPFSLRLDEFAVEYHKGSMAPSDYRSELTVLPSEEAFTISMNNILKFGGYRFYQADYDEDLQGSILAVSYDPWGIGITYCGYILLLVSMIGFFFQKESAFRNVLRRVSGAFVILAAMVLPQSLEARDASVAPKVLPREVSDAFGELYVYYNDRICPFETQARDYCLKAYGKAGLGDADAVQVITGWMFYYDSWKDVPFKVKAKDVGTPRESEKGHLQRNVVSGEALKLYPVADGQGKVKWYSSESELPEAALEDKELSAFIRSVMDLTEQSVREEDWDEVVRIVGKIRQYQEKTAAGLLPSAGKVSAERLYNRLARPRVPFMASITLGMILFILMGVWLSRGRKPSSALTGAMAAVSALLFLYLTLTLGLRWFVSGHAPFVGSYSVMMLMAWLSTIAMLLLYRRFPLIQPLGFLLAGFTMLMASMAGANPRITQMMPVLQSPLLSIHVLSMMMSYTLFGLVALNGILGLAVRSDGARSKLMDVSLVVLYPAVFLLTFGTFLGAVWANISWGTYWAWDPKETWALITILVYSVTLHGGALRPFRNPRFFHLYSILAFLSVLVTYFGVNLLLGGMHSYV